MLRLWIALLALLGCAAALTTVVPAADAKCFLEDVERGEKVYGSFNVFAGGALDIDIKVLAYSILLTYIYLDYQCKWKGSVRGGENDPG